MIFSHGICITTGFIRKKNLPLFVRNLSLFPLSHIQTQSANSSLLNVWPLIFLFLIFFNTTVPVYDDKRWQTSQNTLQIPKKPQEKQAKVSASKLGVQPCWGRGSGAAPALGDRWGQGWALLWHLGAGAGTPKGLNGGSGPWPSWRNPGEGGQDPLVASGPQWFCWNNDLRQAITQLAGGNFKPSGVLTRCCKLVSYF